MGNISKYRMKKKTLLLKKKLHFIYIFKKRRHLSWTYHFTDSEINVVQKFKSAALRPISQVIFIHARKKCAVNLIYKPKNPIFFLPFVNKIEQRLSN